MQSSITIRRAGPHDVPAITDITHAAYAKWIATIGRKPMPMTVDYARAVEEHWIDLAESEGVPIALIEMINNADHLMIENLAVLPEFQGHGLGRTLLVHAQTAATAWRLPRIRLLTNAAFVSNVQFYLHHQYRIDRTKPFMGGTAVYMSKALV